MAVPEKILELVERFDSNRAAYRSTHYNETQLRVEFLDPFLEALGWDVYNKQGYAEAYKDVVHEDAIKVGGATKAPDYCFRIGGTRKFFVEAKKPAIDLKYDVSAAYQIRRYAWSAKLPLSILTDFEEFAVYDCRMRPYANDKVSTARTIYITYNEYDQRWDEIASIFSREAVLKGSFDKYVESTKAKKGTAEVDTAFLKEIESWREQLARHIALRNTNLSQRELNFAVQRTIDRIIFLRICEDRGIEEYERLRALQNGVQVYQRLCQLFRQADDRYNSGLFHFRKEKDRTESPDELTLNLTIDDKILKDNIKLLYYPDSPYEFSVLPSDILGQVYEQFLGKVIRLTPAHHAVVEDKPEVKKAGGVYYTPTYIVDYIVKNTVEKMLKDKTPKQVAKLRILDPACGSGSFLIGAYQYLLDWHRDWYIEHEPLKWAKGRSSTIYQGSGGDWRLTTTERKRILLNNIYGVDIDPQAVEVTKLSLLLKVLEGENEQTLNKQLALFHERALPDLGSNIKCGNSLIGPDFYEDHQMSLLDEDERYRINVFDWDAEFPEIMRAGGFDVVIGNPPWGGNIDKITDYIQWKYPQSTKGYRDSFKLFIEKSINLLRFEGLLSLIVPSAFMFQPRYVDVRRLIKQFHMQKLWNIGDMVFGTKVVAPSSIFIITKKSPPQNSLVEVLDTAYTKDNTERAKISASPTYRLLSQKLYEKTPQEAFLTYFRELGHKEVRLSKVLDCKDCGIKHQRVGCGMEQKGKSDLASRLYYKGPRQLPEDHPYVIGSDLSSSGWYADYSVKRYFRANYKDILRDKEIVYFNESVFDLTQKIVWRQTSDRIRAAIIGKYWFANTLQAGVLLNRELDIRYVLGILNSKFLNYIYIESVKESGRVFPQVKISKIRALPFRTINFRDPTDKALHDHMVALVEQMLSLHKKLAQAKTAYDKTTVTRQIDATDMQIDKLVYELYGLTEEEITTVESTVPTR